jgi:hypothetical protein
MPEDRDGVAIDGGAADVEPGRQVDGAKPEPVMPDNGRYPLK